jgi:hypothetical protein
MRIFKDSLINLTWKDAKCYEKCACQKVGSTEASCLDKDKDAKFRHCPEKSGCVCQLQCYMLNADGIPAEDKLLGRDRLEDWDIKIGDILAKSYDKYDKDRMIMVDHREADHPEADQSTVELLEAHEHMWELPTCKSSQLSLEKSPPCTCGDWRSSETAEFMNALGIGNFQEGHNSEVAKHLFMKDCPKVRWPHLYPLLPRRPLTSHQNLLRANLKPLNHFLAYCELGIRWPHKKDTDNTMDDSYYQAYSPYKNHVAGGWFGPSGGGPIVITMDIAEDIKRAKTNPKHKHHVRLNMIDRRCSEIKKETAGMTENVANLHFCATSEAAKEVFADEVSHINGFKTDKGAKNGNHASMCNRWLNVNNHRWLPGG